MAEGVRTDIPNFGGIAKYKGIKEDIAKELFYLEDKYFQFDKPVPFGEFTLYPATVVDYEDFMMGTSCLTLNKFEDPKGIRMTHLEYLLSKMQDKDEGQVWSLKFTRLLEIVFHIQNGIKCQKCGKVMSYEDYFRAIGNAIKDGNEPVVTCECGGDKFFEVVRYRKNEETKKMELLIDEKVIDHKAFEKLRQYILFQNLTDYRDDSWVDSALREDRKKRMELESKKNGGANATLEKKIVCVAAKTNFSFEQLYNMSIRKFNMLLYAVDDYLNYAVTRIGMMNGMFNGGKDFKLEHWIYKEEKDMYGDTYKSLDTLKNDMQHI